MFSSRACRAPVSSSSSVPGSWSAGRSSAPGINSSVRKPCRASARSRASSVLVSACLASCACQVAIPAPRANDRKTITPAMAATLCRANHLPNRYCKVPRRAVTGLWFLNLYISSTKCPTLSYRRSGSLRKAFRMMVSRSP